MTRTLLAAVAALWLCQIASAEPPQIADGPFQGDLESLRQYKCPDWFRDAKFGIWAHWGPQAVPMEGDWYAKHMYVPGHRQYEHHLSTYGHPSDARLQGDHRAVEGREVGPGTVDDAVQESRRAVLRQHGLAPRQLLPVELEAPPVERGQHGPAARRGRRLAESREEVRPAVRRVGTPGGQLYLVPAQPRIGQDRPQGRRALRRRGPETARTCTISRPTRTTRAGTARTRGGSSSGSSASRNWSTATSPTCCTPTAACRSATRSAPA